MVDADPRYTEVTETFSDRGRLAIEAAILGGQAVLAQKERSVTVKEGGDHNYVTPGDELSQAAIIAAIKNKFPDDLILAEENKEMLPNPEEADHLWIIDPIDGTFNYSKGIPYWGVSVGYAEKGVMKAGAIFNPVTDELYFAEEGRGAYKNGVKIHVSDTVGNEKDGLMKAIVESDLPSKRNKRRLNSSIISGLVLHSHMRGSLVINAVRVAAGDSDLYFVTTFGGAWDIAAASLIMQEAGGVAYDLEGNDLNGKKGGFLATSIVFGNREIVSQFLNLAKPIIESVSKLPELNES